MQAAADQCQVGQCIVSGHFAHAVAKPDACLASREFVLAAPLVCQLARRNVCRDFAETLGVARHDEEQQLGAIQFLVGVENQRFFAFTRAGTQPYRARAECGAPLLSQADFIGWRCDIELDIAAYLWRPRAELCEALGVVGSLRGNEIKRGDSRADQRQEALVAAQGAGREAGIDQG